MGRRKTLGTRLTTSNNSTKVRAARAARLFFLIQPIRSSIVFWRCLCCCRRPCFQSLMFKTRNQDLAAKGAGFACRKIRHQMKKDVNREIHVHCLPIQKFNCSAHAHRGDHKTGRVLTCSSSFKPFFKRITPYQKSM